MRIKPLHFITLVIVMLFLIHDDASAQRRRKKKEAKLSIYDVDSLISPIPRSRTLMHDRIDKEQRRADVLDGKVDSKIYISDDETYNTAFTKAVLKDIDHYQIMIENFPANGKDPAEDNQYKIRYLTAVWELLRDMNADTRLDQFYYRKAISNMRDLMIAKHEGRSLAFVKENVSMATLNNVKVLFPEANAPERAYIYTEMGKKEPQIMIKRLTEYANDPFADEIIAAAAKVVPQEVYNYGSSSNYVMSGAVRRSKDPLVQTIVRISQESKSPLKAMPFLSDIYNNRLTIAEIDKIAANQDEYFQNLVRLKIQNVGLGASTYTDELKYRGLKYVREMNDLHESPDPVRFKCIEKFSPVVLYFIMVYGQDEIYTSSFLGTYKRMIERMKPMTGDQLLDTLHYDRFRTFIRMCAGYNTLNNFLATMDQAQKTNVMTRFIAGLEKGKEDDLEDAVDVADAFGSIDDKELAAFLQQQVKNNYETSYKQRSKKGVIIYGLLSTLFEGAKAQETEEAAERQSQLLDLPPINLVQYKNLASDSSGIVYEQFFFYGDEDGKNSYNSFLTNFKGGKWKITNSKYWTTITSTSGKPVVVYANLPLAEPADEEAQSKLVEYLQEHNIHPTVLVHRGHSYHLPLTLDRLSKENRIVVLGSCGGYHNLGTVLDRAPDAHIISSKQVGAMNVNEPIIRAINDQLLAGKNIDWINTWKALSTQFATKKNATVKALFDDYVPPHKNLGAIFIKAYRRQFNADVDDESES